ncbi:MAG: substrate-binding domain-containing protein [Lapillicoccus sp.]
MLTTVVALFLVVTTTLMAGSSASGETLAPIKGSGSTYVGIAMRQWVAQGQSQGWSVEYTPTGSPTGMNTYNLALNDYAATEAEFVSLALNPSRGYQYVPDVAGATAIMYNVKESSGRQVDYLHLDRKTVARIFIGTITRWSDPAISATNKGIVFPDQPIRVVLRGNSSGTTALFYDFIANTLGAEYTARFNQYECGAADVRPVLIQCLKPGFIPSTISFNDSDQIAQYVSGPTGLWSMGFDEFGYAKVYKTSSAWIQNAAGTYVLPYAQNISAALESARLRPDLSQDLSAVYASPSAQAYPISAYSYLVTQCASAADRATCKGPYPTAGVSATLAKWMSYIACDGQVTMASQGYSPLPVNLSQEMANSVGRLTGVAPVTLSAANCSNPRFSGSLGAGSVSPCDPFLCGTKAGASTGGAPSNPAPSSPGSGASKPAAGTASGAGTAASGTKAGSAAGGAAVAAGGAAGTATAKGSTVSADGRVIAVGGGSNAAAWRNAQPVEFSAALPDDPFGWLPAALLLAILLVPALVTLVARRSPRG